MIYSSEVDPCKEYLNNMANHLIASADPTYEGENDHIKSLPEIFFGKNRLYIINPLEKLCVSFSPFDAIL